MNEVTSINIPPKKIEERYRDELIVVEFDPNNKLWNWKFTINPSPMTLHGTGCKSPEEAIKEAKHRVDLINGSV
jgi:hypothetical protein